MVLIGGRESFDRQGSRLVRARFDSRLIIIKLSRAAIFQNESDTISSPRHASRRPASFHAVADAHDAYATDEPRRFTAAVRLEPGTDNDALAIAASKFRSPGRLEVHRTKGAPPIGLRRKLAQGLLPVGPIQTREATRLRSLPSVHQC